MAKSENPASEHRVQPLAVLGVIWFALIVVDLVLGSLTPNSALRSYELPFTVRLALVCTNATIIGFVVCIIWFSVLLASQLARWTTSGRQRRRWGRAAGSGWRRGLARWLAAVAVFVVSLVYLTSWSIFQDTGQFLDHNSMLMSRADPLGMFLHALHMRPWSLVLGVLLAALLAMTACHVVPELRRVRQMLETRKTADTFRYLALMALAGAVWGYLVPSQSQATRTDTETGIVSSLADVYAEARDDRNGPLSHGVADLYEIWWKLGEAPALGMPDLADGQLPAGWNIRRAEQVTLDDYRTLAEAGDHRNDNVIILLVESLRTDQLRSYGGGRDVMPNVDGVASQSLVFPLAYTQASHSNYADMCPLSSHYPLRENGIHVYPPQPRYPRVMIYDVLKRLGYRTAVFSSQNEHWGQMINYLSTGHLDRLLHAATYEGPTYVCPEDVGFFEWVQRGKKCGKIDDRLTIDEAMRWIAQDRERPFCMYINLQNSHIPYVVPPDFPRRFSQAPPDFTIGFNQFPQHKVDQVRDAYSDSLAYVDHQIGRLVEFLKSSGQWDRTVLVITGDTGQAFNEHGFAAHANKLYDEVMRVPLIIHAPGLAAGRDQRLAQHVDVPPTVLDLLRLPAHPSFQGRSLLGTPSPQSPAFLVVQSPLASQVAIVQGHLKLIFDVPTGRFHLYDLAVDPDERHDVAGRRPNTVGQLAPLLRRWCQLQLDYYADTAAQERQYPPVLEFVEP